MIVQEMADPRLSCDYGASLESFFVPQGFSTWCPQESNVIDTLQKIHIE
jgi:hypothetical protein